MTIDQFLDRLFTSGAGQVGNSLVLVSGDWRTPATERNLGGLCREAVRDRALALLPSRFYLGQRVRFSERGMQQFGCTTRGPLVGTVARIRETEFGRYLTVAREGLKHAQRYHESNWEPVPVAEVPPDAVCELLVKAYQAGAIDAANALADRLFELRGGTKSAPNGVPA